MPKSAMTKNKRDKSGLRSAIGQTLMTSRRAIWGVGVFSAFINLLMLTGPIYMLQVYDRVLVSRSVSTLVAISLLMAFLYFFMGLLDIFRSRVLIRLATWFEKTLGGRTFDVWLKQGLYGKSAERVQPLHDLSSLKQFMSGNALGAFFDIPWIIVYIGVIYMLHFSLGLIATFGAIIIFTIAIYNEIATRKPALEARKMRRIEQNIATQVYRNSETVVAMGMGGHMKGRWSAIGAQAEGDALLSSDRGGNATASTKAFRMFIQSAVLGAGGYLAVLNIITPGMMIAGSIIMGRALAPVQMAVGQWRSFNIARDAYKRLNKFYAVMPENEDTTSLPKPTGKLSIENLFAGPPGAKMAVLQGLNFKLQPGDGLGVIGPSASGKSTLARMLVGVWSPQRGAVRLDGATFDQWDRDELGPHIGYLPQEVELFDGTIGENIGRFNPQASDEQIVRAARRAGVHELILKFPDGYETRIGEGGAVLSGGQTQRIALARAIYGDPVLIIMDEPNANLDTEGDMALTRAIAGLRKEGKVVIVMTHRHSAIVAIDKLLMLRDGKQVAFGKKEDVLEKVLAEQQQTNAASMIREVKK